MYKNKIKKGEGNLEKKIKKGERIFF